MAYTNEDQSSKSEITPEYLYSGINRLEARKECCYSSSVVEISRSMSKWIIFFNIMISGSGTIVSSFYDTRFNGLAFAIGVI